jgi:hypothetical protein
MNQITRRHLLAASAVLPVGAALAGCVASTVNGVTTVTVNLATVDAYAQAIGNAVTTLLTIPALSTGLGVLGVATITTASTDVTKSISALDTANAGSESFTFSTASVPAALASLQADANTIVSNVGTVVTSLGSTLAANVTTTVDALETVVSLLTALVPTGAVSAVKLKMTEAQALAVLGVVKK